MMLSGCKETSQDLEDAQQIMTHDLEYVPLSDSALDGQDIDREARPASSTRTISGLLGFLLGALVLVASLASGWRAAEQEDCDLAAVTKDWDPIAHSAWELQCQAMGFCFWWLLSKVQATNNGMTTTDLDRRLAMVQLDFLLGSFWSLSFASYILAFRFWPQVYVGFALLQGISFFLWWKRTPATDAYSYISMMSLLLGGFAGLLVLYMTFGVRFVGLMSGLGSCQGQGWVLHWVAGACLLAVLWLVKRLVANGGDLHHSAFGTQALLGYGSAWVVTDTLMGLTLRPNHQGFFTLLQCVCVGLVMVGVNHCNREQDDDDDDDTTQREQEYDDLIMDMEEPLLLTVTVV